MRKEIFSIRKIKKIAGSVVIGSALFGMGTPVSAASPSTYHYVDEANLTEQEKALLHTEVPPQDEEVYYLIYRKIEQVLPQTGVRENMAFTAAGLLAASSIVLVVSKKKRHKILGALLITASGAATFIPSQAVAVELSQVIRASSNEGVVQIDGYRYVGYLSERELKQISHPEEAKTTVEVPQTAVKEVTPDVPTTVVPKKEETRIETLTEEIPFETITQADTTLEKGKSRVLYAGQAGVRTIQTQVIVVNGVETRKVLSSEVTKQPISQIIGIGAKEQPVTPSTPVEQPKAENPKVEQPKVEKPKVETPKAEQPKVEEPKVETPKVEQPKVEEPKVETPKVEPPKVEEPKAETPKVEQPKVATSKKGTQEEGKEGQALTQPELPEYHEAKGVQAVEKGEKQGEALVQPELPEYTATVSIKGTQEPGKEGQATEQPENPEYKVTTSTVEKSTESKLDFTTEVVPDDTKYLDEEVVERQGVPGVQVTKTTYETVEGVETDKVVSTTTEVKTPAISKIIKKGTKPIEGTVDETEEVEIPFETKTQEDDTLKRGTEEIAQQGKKGKKKITKTYKTIRGEKTTEPPTVTEKVIEQPQDEIIKKGTKGLEKPTLQWAKTDKDVLKKSATASYTLNKPAGVEIKSIKLAVKDKDGKVVKEVTVAENNLNVTLDKLKYYQGYTLSTTMVYDRGEGEETEKLEDKQIQLDLKKVEIKNIKETSLMSVDDAGNETDSSLLSSIPSDVKPFYLKVTTRDNKVTRLAVNKIEEVTVEGKTLYKVTATAPDLVQRTADNTFTETYTHYFAKPKTRENDVYYDFNELVKAMQENPTGNYKIGSDLNAVNVKPAGKSYVTNLFKGTLSSTDGNRFAIHNITRPLFGNIEGGSVKDLQLENVNIEMPWANNVAPLANVVKRGNIENIKVTGKVSAGNDITGMVNKLDESTMTNVAFIGKLHISGDKGNWAGGLVSENWRSNVDKGYVEADVTGEAARFGGIIAKVNHGTDPRDVGQKGFLKNSVAKGTIDIKKPIEVGGLVHSNWSWGLVENNVTMMKVKNGGEILYGSKDLNEDKYFGADWVRNTNFTVNDVSEGLQSYKLSNKWKGVSQDEANKKIEAMGITADKFTSTKPVEDRLNNSLNKEEEYKAIDDYDASRELAYRNIEKLQPFYNKEWIVNQGNKLAANSPLMTKEVLSVTAMKGNDFVTDLTDADRIMVHYADKTKDIFNISLQESQVQQVKEYRIAELGEVVYTPNIVDKNRTDLVNDIMAKLSPVELQSDTIYKHFGRNGDGKVNAVKNLYLEESFQYVKDHLEKFVTKLVQNEDHQLNTDEAAKRALVKKIDDNKAAVLLGLSYLNRYYGVKFDDFNIKELMLFKPDFYGKNVSVLDRIINIGSKENNVKGDRTQDAYREVISDATGKGNLNDFLKYNMELFTNDTDLNDWFIHSTKDNVYVVEPTTTNPAFVDKKHRAYEGLNNDVHGKMILPLLNLKDAHMFLISTYNTMAYSSFEKYGKYTEAEREAFKAEINKVAKGQQNYLDFWSRLSLDKVRNQLLKSQNMVPTPVLDNQNYKGISTDRYGHTASGKDVAPVRELYGPTGRYHATDGRMGAVARVYPKPYKDDSVFFMVTDMISDFGISAFTHETTHVNDRMVYLGGSGHREGTDLEAFAQGMLQSPAESSPNGDFKALGLNMAYERPNNGNQWYNTNPNDLASRDEIDHYMKGFNDTLMLLDYLEGEAVLNQHDKELNSAWFKKVDKKLRGANTKNQYDAVRDLNDEEKAYDLNSVNDLVEKNFMTKHGPGNAIYDPTGFGTAYVTVPITAGIYGGNTSEGAPGSMSFKHNTFRIWGYYGYEKGFLNYASNMLKAESKKAGKATLGDDFIINKISEGRFTNLEDWKKAYFKEVVDKAKLGMNAIEVDGTTYNSYEELQRAFAAAVEKDKATMKTDKNGNKSVSMNNTVTLKEKVYKKLLQQTNSFKTSIFK